MPRMANSYISKLCFVTLLMYYTSLHVCCAVAQIPVWYKWVYWGVDPISYAQKAMAVNEFGAPRWQNVYLPDGRSIGNAVLDGR